MDFYGNTSSPSVSRSNTVSSNGLYFGSNSDSSIPNSPHVDQKSFSNSLPYKYETYQYSATPVEFYPAQATSAIHVQLTSSILNKTDKRKKRGDSCKSSEPEATPSMHLRRRAQNRASQRAFRERKEKHVKGLEHQLEDLHERYQDLLQSYQKHVDEVSRLNGRIAELVTELTASRQCQDTSLNDFVVFDKFDAFSLTKLLYNPDDTSYDPSPGDPTTELLFTSSKIRYDLCAAILMCLFGDGVGGMVTKQTSISLTL